jgi:hypothetical protein
MLCEGSFVVFTNTRSLAYPAHSTPNLSHWLQLGSFLSHWIVVSRLYSTRSRKHSLPFSVFDKLCRLWISEPPPFLGVLYFMREIYLLPDILLAARWKPALDTGRYQIPYIGHDELTEAD